MTDPDEGAAALAEDSASWGSLEIWAENRNLCAHMDQGETLAAVHWYLLPFAEWWAENWNAVLHEEKPPNVNIADTAIAALEATRLAPPISTEHESLSWEQQWFDWRSRHALRAARSGGLFPNIVIRRLRDYVEVSWDDEPEAGSPAGFGFSSARGSALFHPRDVAEPLHEVLVPFAESISRLGVAPERTDALRERLALLASPGQEHDRLSWTAGLGTANSTVPESQEGDDRQRQWDRVVAELTRNADEEAAAAALEAESSTLVVTASSPAALMFSSVSPAVAADDVRTLSAVLLDQYSSSGPGQTLTEHVRDVPLDSLTLPWEQGYELAESLHDELGLDLRAGWVDVEGFLDGLGVRVVVRELLDGEIRAASLVGPRHLPTIVHNRSSRFTDTAPARRFTVAHELCHLLYDRARGAKVAIASGPWAPRGIEKRAGAFAAMFLMPTELVESTVARLAVSVRDIEGVTQLAAALRVSRASAIQHLYNLTFMTESDREELLRRSPD